MPLTPKITEKPSDSLILYGYGDPLEGPLLISIKLSHVCMIRISVMYNENVMDALISSVQARALATELNRFADELENGL